MLDNAAKRLSASFICNFWPGVNPTGNLDNVSRMASAYNYAGNADLVLDPPPQLVRLLRLRRRQPVPIWQTARTSLSVGTSLYSQGDALGVKLAINVPDNGIIRGMTITDVDDEASVTVNVWIFEAEPAGIAANSAFALADADLELVNAIHHVNTEFDAINGRVHFEEMAVPYETRGGQLHIQCELEGAATPTWTATTNVKIRLFIEH